MLNLIPHFIHQQYKVKNLSGELTAAVMFVDITGFTSITEAMMRHGKEGAETLSYMLNNVFTAVIDQIYKRGGFISGFAGDSVTIIFSESDRLKPFFAALAIQRIFQKKGLGKSKFGEFPLSAKIAISYGKVQWGIVGAGKRRAYYFRGEAVENCANKIKLASAGETVLDESYYERLGGARGSEGGMIITTEERPTEGRPRPARLPRLSKSVARHFLPEEILSAQLSGEFRDIVPVFISFESGLSSAELDKLTDMVMEQTANFGAFFNGLDFGDKGATFFVIFGAPKAHEDNIERAVEFALAVKKESPEQLRIGICSGTVYAGVIGSLRRCNYTGLGDTVNLSARFMQGAGPGQIWVSSEVAKKVRSTHTVKELGNLAFKGKSEPAAVYELVAPQAVSKELFFAGQMVGRDKELADAKKLCQSILDGNFGGVFYIYGEPGIGKSRFLYELSRGLEPQIKTLVLQTDSILRKSMNPFVYLLKRYFSQTETNKYEENLANFETAWNELINRLQSLGDSAKAEPVLKELKRTKSLVGALLGLFWKGSLYQELDPKGRFQNTIYALKEFFKAESLLQPIMLAFEDMQWIDGDSLETVRTLSRKIENFPMVILGLSRLKDDGSKPVFALDDEVRRAEMTIEHLPQEAVGAFIEACLVKKVDPELLRFIKSRTEGNPFYIEQFCLYLEENELIKLQDGGYHLVREELEVPDGIRPILIARLDRLSKDLRELVQKAAVLGREFEVEILSRMLAGRPLDRLLVKGEQEVIWSALSEILYIFKHALLRDAAYEMQLKKQLRELHKTAACAIKTVYGDMPTHLADLAFHYEKAELDASAKEYLEKAGDYAKESYKNEEAMNLFQRLLKYIDDAQQEILVNSKLASILVLIGDWDRAKEIYCRNLEMAERLGDDVAIASAKIDLGKHLHSLGDYPEAFRLSEEALRLYTDLHHQKGIKDALSNLGLLYCDQGEFDRSLEAYERALQMVEATNDKNAIAGLSGNIGNVYLQTGNLPKAMECYQRCLRLSEETGNLRSMGMASVNIGIIYAQEGEFDKALEYYQKQLTNASAIGDKQGIGGVMANSGWVQLAIGNYQKAMKDFQEMLQTSEELNDVPGISFAEYNIGNILKELGEYSSAEKHYLRAVEIGKKIQLKYYLCSYLYDMADLQFRMEKTELSKSHAQEALTIAQEVNKKEAIISNEVLLAQILALTDKNNAMEKLISLLASASASEGAGKALVYYELYRLTGDDRHRKEAVTLYRLLHKKMPAKKYQDRIRELEPDTA